MKKIIPTITKIINSIGILLIAISLIFIASNSKKTEVPETLYTYRISGTYTYIFEFNSFTSDGQIQIKNEFNTTKNEYLWNDIKPSDFWIEGHSQEKLIIKINKIGQN